MIYKKNPNVMQRFTVTAKNTPKTDTQNKTDHFETGGGKSLLLSHSALVPSTLIQNVMMIGKGFGQ